MKNNVYAVQKHWHPFSAQGKYESANPNQNMYYTISTAMETYAPLPKDYLFWQF